jgi:lipoprotein-releasing system ATP-binding protein
MSKPILRLNDITRDYKTDAGVLPVLRGVDLALSAGEIVGLVGPSGSGKSSLLHAAGLLERPTSGWVSIDGINTNDLNEGARTAMRRTMLGFVYQFHHLLPEFDALDNAAMPLVIAEQGWQTARRVAGDMLTAMGLGDRLHHRPGQLSGGEQQRVAIARALVHKPKVLLADEPTGNLDPATTLSVFKALTDAVRSTGAGALIATHNLALMDHMDHVVRLDGGIIKSL